jgi:hypothetical protein
MSKTPNYSIPPQQRTQIRIEFERQTQHRVCNGGAAQRVVFLCRQYGVCDLDDMSSCSSRVSNDNIALFPDRRFGPKPLDFVALCSVLDVQIGAQCA